jgi:hypothetical protein
MAGMPSRPTPPEMISDRSTVVFSKSVSGHALKSGERCAAAGDEASITIASTTATSAGSKR